MAAGYTNYVSYEDPATKRPRIGHLDLDTDTIHALSFQSGAPVQSLYQVIEAGEENISLDEFEDPTPVSRLRVLPPITGRDILAVGKNYFDHAKEFNRSGFDSSDKVDVPSHPVIFTKRATSIIAHGDQIYHHPDFTHSLDYEGEIGVIVGKSGYRVAQDNAMDHVWGYTIINDVTARERQRDHKQFFIGKSGDTFCPMGPIARPAKHLPDVLRVQTVVNGKLEQDATSNDLIFSVPFLIKTLSEGMTLQPGDVIATGTPAGVGIGKKPPVYLSPGDTISVSVTGLGTLTNAVTADLPPPPPSSHPPSATADLPTLTTHLLHATLPPTNNPVTFLPTPGFPASSFSALCASLLQHPSSSSSSSPDTAHHNVSYTTATVTATAANLFPTLAHPLRTLTTSTTTTTQPLTLITHGPSALTALHLASSPTTNITNLILINPPPLPPPPPPSSLLPPNDDNNDTTTTDTHLPTRLRHLIASSRRRSNSDSGSDTAATPPPPTIPDLIAAHEIGSKAKTSDPLAVAACRLSAPADAWAWEWARAALLARVVAREVAADQGRRQNRAGDDDGGDGQWSDGGLDGLDEVRADVLVITGDEDWMAPAEGWEGWVGGEDEDEAEARGSGSGEGKKRRREIRVLEGVGHWAMLEDVRGVAEAVRGFLAAAAPAA
ncbi:fumarylacetoacetate hydrolase [Diplodia corticola]|uniref:Fumarylacetoacetate hydrolase n=1 Tax=Diplodia corticola TaxID=236234 RepID=A0A1J9QZZ1_9PEZI|nr:fumarylacetoacetate hydrolase [Diplodia corticola]OJD33952.1 fumarylacetoacetate hydrolase [Diplodia corticola]